MWHCAKEKVAGDSTDSGTVNYDTPESGTDAQDPNNDTPLHDINEQSFGYLGWQTSSKTCTKNYTVRLFEPKMAGRYPVFMYAVGTGAVVDTSEGELTARYMARRGFIAAVVSYDTAAGLDCNGMLAKAACVYDTEHTQSAAQILCSRDNADCEEMGIVLGGLSQGASLSVLAKNTNPHVRAVWVMSFGGGSANNLFTSCYVDSTRKLADDRLRVINGVDGQLLSRDNLQNATGIACETAVLSCLRENGSGYYLVDNNQVEDEHADHCYYDVAPDMYGNEVGCTTEPPGFDSGWEPPAQHAWSLTTNLNWLVGFAH